MLLNFLKLSFRNLLRQRFSSFVNITGLALGFASFIVIALYVYDEKQYDQFHAQKDRVFRIVGNTFNADLTLAQLPALFYDPLRQELPEIEHVVRINAPHRPIEVSLGEKSFMEAGLIFADTSFFDIFSFELQRGSLEDFNSNPLAILITHEMAQKYFGEEDPLGKILKYNQTGDMEVAGILKNIPQQSHLQFDIIANYDMLRLINPFVFAVWGNYSANYYVLTKPGADPGSVSGKLLPLFGKAQGREYDPEVSFMQLQNLKEVYLGSSGIDTNIRVAAGSRSGLTIFSLSAVLLLLLACFNYVNLASAKSTSRAREVGIRKVLGANRNQLIVFFLVESVLVSFLAMALAIGLVEITLPYFSALSGKQLSFGLVPLPLLILFLAGSLILVSLLAGVYPAFIMSRFQPAVVLKGSVLLISQQLKSRFSPNLKFRQALLVMQFAISIGLVCGSIILYQQTHHVLSQSGFEKESLIVMRNNNMRQKDFYTRFRNQLTQHPFITGISAGEHVPTDPIGNQGGLKLSHLSDEERSPIFFATVDFDYFETLGSSMLWGRTFDRSLATDTLSAVILNESAAKALMVSQDEAPMLAGFWDGNHKRVIGVVEDILYESAHRQVKPTAFYVSYTSEHMSATGQILIRFRTQNLTQVVEAVEGGWKQQAEEGSRLEYYFMDSRYENLYSKELQIAGVARIFTLLALIIACLGLMGTTVYLMEARKKELGIRKVLGANTMQIATLISKEFMILIIFSLAIAWPASYYFMSSWLQGFAYRIDPSPWLFVGAGLGAMMLSLVIINSLVLKQMRESLADR